MVTAALGRGTRDERRSLNFRMPRVAVEIIDRAAARVHKDRTEFVLEASLARAQETLLEQTMFPLSGSDFEAFVAALDNPQAPNVRLEALAGRKPAWEKP